MTNLLLSEEQRFTCAQCGRCCHRTTVPITIEEAAGLRKAGAVRWFDEGDGSTSRDPFELIPGHAPLLRIRKRADGACGFLSPDGRCRIHEELGADRKPIACRLFPYSFRPTGHEVIVATSCACPTVIANDGAALTAQRGELTKLRTAQTRAFPDMATPIEFVAGRTIPREGLARVRVFLTLLLDRSPDIRENLRRIAALLEDWSRPRVLQLEPEGLIEYLELTGNYALSHASAGQPARPASRVARLLFRGFLFAVLAMQVRLDSKRGGVALGATLAQLLAHVHGLAPPTAGFDLRRAMRLTLPLDDPSIHAIAHRYVQAGFETLGATRRPVLDEIAMRIADLNAACVVGAMRAAAAGRSAVDTGSLTQGLLACGDLGHADAGGGLSVMLTTLAGGTEALYLFPPLRAA